jgi:hypothetical protein
MVTGDPGVNYTIYSQIQFNRLEEDIPLDAVAYRTLQLYFWDAFDVDNLGKQT